MATPHLVCGSRFAVHSHALAGVFTVATWLSLCTGFGLEVVPARDPVARLYQMDAARDSLARQAARPTAAATPSTVGPGRSARPATPATPAAAAPVPST